jgi:three-Cys-motif partner protein
MPEFGVEEKQFFDGSARIALGIKPDFQHYIFVEKVESRSKKLENLKIEFPDKAKKIKVINEESNKYLQKICKKDWSNHRAVVFLDPYGMQVKWKTIEAIASTKAIDLWILFPLGQAINRLLKRDGNIRHSTKKTLTEFFGEEKWFEAFYTKSDQLSIIEENIKKYQKNADFMKISSYFSERLNTIFKDRVSKPKVLYNSTNNPLFLLFFAAGNERGARTAIKIAEYILES